MPPGERSLDDRPLQADVVIRSGFEHEHYEAFVLHYGPGSPDDDVQFLGFDATIPGRVELLTHCRRERARATRWRQGLGLEQKTEAPNEPGADGGGQEHAGQAEEGPRVEPHGQQAVGRKEQDGEQQKRGRGLAPRVLTDFQGREGRRGLFQ